MLAVCLHSHLMKGSEKIYRNLLHLIHCESFFYKSLLPAKILISLKIRLLKLEALRGFAALYVLLHHVSSSYLGLKSSFVGFPFRFGQEAVLVFFSSIRICHSLLLSAFASTRLRQLPDQTRPQDLSYLYYRPFPFVTHRILLCRRLNLW